MHVTSTTGESPRVRAARGRPPQCANAPLLSSGLPQNKRDVPRRAALSSAAPRRAAPSSAALSSLMPGAGNIYETYRKELLAPQCLALRHATPPSAATCPAAEPDTAQRRAAPPRSTPPRVTHGPPNAAETSRKALRSPRRLAPRRAAPPSASPSPGVAPDTAPRRAAPSSASPSRVSEMTANGVPHCGHPLGASGARARRLVRSHARPRHVWRIAGKGYPISGNPLGAS